MKLRLFTIVLDGMPWIACHLPVFNRLNVDWEWHVMEGVARNVGCTSWCKPIEPRLSKDGTSQYLDSIASHPRVKIHRKPSWNGKIEMVNRPLETMISPSVLVEIDADEIWQTWQLEAIWSMFAEFPDRNLAFFRCRYFVGPNIITTGTRCYGDNVYEWQRAWRVEVGDRFSKHEPPVMAGVKPVPFTKDETTNAGLVFDHYAYATEPQVRFKEQYYGYAGAVEQWRKLQANRRWPVRLRDFLPWVRDHATAATLHATTP